MKEILIITADQKFSTLPATGLQVGRANDEVFLMSNSNYNTAIMQCPMITENIHKLNSLIEIIYKKYIANSLAYMCIMFPDKINITFNVNTSVVTESYIWDGNSWVEQE